MERLAPLSALAAEAGAEVRGDAGITVADATYATAEVRPGSLFFCVPGARADGHDFAAAALEGGAAALVVERWLDLECSFLNGGGH